MSEPMQIVSVRMPDQLVERLKAKALDEDEGTSVIARRALARYLDGEDMVRAMSPGADPAIVADGVPTEVAVLLRFTVRTDSLHDARAVADRALTMANAKIRAVGADDEIEVVGPWFNRTSIGWNAEMPPPVTLHFVGDSCPDHVHWRWNGVTVDGMAGVFGLPQFECSPTTLMVRMPGIAEPLPLGLVDRGHGDPDQWYVDMDGTHSQVLASIRPVGTWQEPASEGEITGPLGQLGPVRLIGERERVVAEAD